MEKSIRVQILGRELALRVQEEDEEITQAIASYVDERMTAFKEAHPDQSKLTSAIFAAMAVTEELFETRQRLDALHGDLDAELTALDDLLAGALAHDGHPEGDVAASLTDAPTVTPAAQEE